MWILPKRPTFSQCRRAFAEEFSERLSRYFACAANRFGKGVFWLDAEGKLHRCHLMPYAWPDANSNAPRVPRIKIDHEIPDSVVPSGRVRRTLGIHPVARCLKDGGHCEISVLVNQLQRTTDWLAEWLAWRDGLVASVSAPPCRLRTADIDGGYAWSPAAARQYHAYCERRRLWRMGRIVP
jgi:hypothetical protein